LHVDPDAQFVHPVHPMPAHCPYFAEEQPPVVVIVVGVVVVDVDGVTDVIVDGVVTGGVIVVMGEVAPLSWTVRTA